MKIGFVGDMILSETAVVSDEIAAILQTTDLNIGNLEAPFIKDNHIPVKKTGLHQLTPNVHLLQKLNIKIVSLANNHMMDFGLAGLQATINHLAYNNIGFTGAGLNRDEANQPAVFETNGQKICIFGVMQKYYSNSYFAEPKKAGIAPLSVEKLIHAANHHGGDLNILYVHWNQEFEDYPEPFSKSISEILSPFFPIIVGSHSHCIQGITSTKGSTVVYSLGNFLFPHKHYYNTYLKPYPSKCYSSMILIWNSENQTNPIEIIPIVIGQDGEHLELDKTNWDERIDLIRKQSNPLLLNNHDYINFYSTNRLRKNRPFITRSCFRNFFNIQLRFFIRDVIQYLIDRLVRFLEVIRLKDKIKTWISYFISNH